MANKIKYVKISIAGILLLASVFGTIAWMIYPFESVPRYYAGIEVKYNNVDKVYTDPGPVTINDPLVQLELISTKIQNDKHAVIAKDNVTLYSNIVWRIDSEKIGYLYKKYGGDEDQQVSENIGRKTIQNIYRILRPDKARWLFNKPDGSYKKSLIDTTLQMNLMQIRSVNDSEIANTRLKITDDLGKEGVLVQMLEISSVPEPQKTKMDYDQETNNSWRTILLIGFVSVVIFGIIFVYLIKNK